MRSRIERILDFAKASGWRTGENPARWKGHLKELLPLPGKLKKVRHHPAMPYDQMAAFMSELRARDGISARALEFTILTACRTGEIIGAKWDEIDLDAKTWTIPQERMKAGKEHKVPLTPRVIEILQSLPREEGNSYVFIGGKKDAPLSNMAMLELMKGMRPGYVTHGFRSTFRDWAADRTNHQNHVAEMALAHTIGDKVEASYRRGFLFEKRRRLMADWDKFCATKTIATTADNVMPLQRSA